MKGLRRTHSPAVAMLIVAALLAAPLLGQTSPYVMNSRCEFNDGASAGDPAANGNSRVCLTQTTKAACEQLWFCWWRDTTNQNALAQHTSDEFPGQVFQLYSSADLNVLVYASAGGPNLVALLTSSEFLLVGIGGGRNEANQAKVAFQSYWPGFTSKTLIGLVYPNAHPETYWGGTYWRSVFRSTPPAPAYAHAGWEAAQGRQQEVAQEMLRRQTFAYGTNLTWGVDSFLGLGWAKEYRPSLPSFAPPSVLISTNTDIHLEGIPVTLIPGNTVDAELIVWLPRQKIAIVPSMGKYFTEAASIVHPVAGINEQLSKLDMIRGRAPEVLLPLNGLPISGATAISSALTAQYDALKYVKDETIKYINVHVPLDDIVNMVTLPPPLASSPYNQEFVDRVPAAVRAVYHEYMGWFNGDPARLATLSTAERARRMIAFGGGENQVLSYAHGLLTEHTRSGAIMAVDVLGMLRLIYPSAKANAFYVQALKMLAWTEPSAELRNYYLTRALEVTTGLAVTGTPVPIEP